MTKHESMSDVLIAAAGVRLERQRYHQDRAEELCRMADEWLDVDEATLTERGYGMAMVWIDLADLHLRLRELTQ